MARQSRDAQALHAAIFREVPETITAAIREIYHRYLPRPCDVLVVATVLLVCTHSLGRQLVGGSLLGYGLGTCIEHALHKYWGHASQSQLRQMERILAPFGALGTLLLRSAAATARHGTIHHAGYARNCVDRFAPPTGATTSGLPTPARGREGRIDAMVLALSPWRPRISTPRRSVFVSRRAGRCHRHADRRRRGVIALPLSLLWPAPAVSLPPRSLCRPVPSGVSLRRPYYMTKQDALERTGWLMRWLLGSRYVQRGPGHIFIKDVS
jgi:hypothetical protein